MLLHMIGERSYFGNRVLTIFSSCSGHVGRCRDLLLRRVMMTLYGFPHGTSSTTSRNSVQHCLLLRLITLVSLDRANLNVSSNLGMVGFSLADCDGLLILWHSARSCAISSLHQWTGVCGFLFLFLGMAVSWRKHLPPFA